jgi:predicted ArsR family transcriptional regulator
MNQANNTQSQKRRLLEYLIKHQRITTLAARQQLDVMHPAARVQELRADGNNIVTFKRHIDNHHKVAEYVLLSQ